mmetsp:Transcript_4365/g.12835  ORF Transcript_4365/g.12835 Transcript_4365/m.12835 type:complete len:91 (-) Transcript_4365:95-367(-)
MLSQRASSERRRAPRIDAARRCARSVGTRAVLCGRAGPLRASLRCVALKCPQRLSERRARSVRSALCSDTCPRAPQERDRILTGHSVRYK